MARVKIRIGYVDAPRYVTAVLVNRYFAVAKVNRAWELIHRPSALYTQWKNKRTTQAQMIALGHAATKRFQLSTLKKKDFVSVRKELMEQGSAEWSKSFRKRRRLHT